MLIVDPTQGGQELARDLESTAGDLGLRGRVCLLSNSKPNAAELLSEVAAEFAGLKEAPLLAKRTASMPAPTELLVRIARDYDAALVAVGD